MGLFSKDPTKGVGSKSAKAGRDFLTGQKANTTAKTIFGGRVSAHTSWAGGKGKKS